MTNFTQNKRALFESVHVTAAESLIPLINSTNNYTVYDEDAANVSSSTLDVMNKTVYIEQDVLLRYAWIKAAFIVCYAIIFVIGLMGNSLVVFVVLRNKAMQTITNVFITNLAISDILMCLLAVPITPWAYFIQNWIFGEVLCHLLPIVLVVSVLVSTLTSIAIAVDRFIVIVHPFMTRMKIHVCFILIATIWVISICISLPEGIHKQVTFDDKKEVIVCEDFWVANALRNFIVVLFILQYIIPGIVIAFCYVRVSLVLLGRAKARLGSKSRERELMEIKRMRRTNRMLIAMVAIFICCWLPLNIINMCTELATDFIHPNWKSLVFFTAHLIAMSSTVYNPFLYAWMNENFKKEFKQVLPSCIFERRHVGRGTNGTTTQYTTVDNQQSVVNLGLLEKNDKMSVNPKIQFSSHTEQVDIPVDSK